MIRGRLIGLSLALVAVVSTFPVPAVAQECGSEQTADEAIYGEPVIDFGKRYKISLPIRHNVMAPLREDLSEGTRYLRALIKVSRLGSGNWILTVRDGQYRVIQVFTREDFLGSPTLWTVRIPGPGAWFDLVLVNASVPPEVKVIEFIAMPEESKKNYYSVRDPDNPQFVDLFPGANRPASTSSADRRLGDTVGFLMASYGQKSWCCSGVMVASDLFLTNWHCGGLREIDEKYYWDRDICHSALIDLSWDNDEISRDYICTKVIDKNRNLDFALLRVKPLNAAGPARPSTITMATLGAGEDIKIIHHPGCRPKQISQGRHCMIKDLSYKSPMGPEAVDFTHVCDTAGGSSGAPVFHQNGRLVGLHHLGYMRKANGECDEENKAVWVKKIVERLERTAPNEADRLIKAKP